MGNQTEITLSAAAWGPELATMLKRIWDADRHLSAWAAMIETNRAQALFVIRGGKKIGAMIWEQQQDADGPAIAIHAIWCAPQRGCDMTVAIDQIFSELGRVTGAVRLRFWTARQGLVRKCAGLGYRRSFVIEKDLDQ